MKLELSKEPISALVRDWPRLESETEKCKCMFITISPATHIKFAGKKLEAIDYLTNINKTSKQIVKQSSIVKTIKTYGALPQKCQFNYCLAVFHELYLEFMGFGDEAEFVGTWELNEKGNVHLHILLYAPSIQDDTRLSIMRRDIYNHDIAIKNHKGKRDHMNHIVFADKPRDEIIKYMDKCYDINTGSGLLFNFMTKRNI